MLSLLSAVSKPAEAAYAFTTHTFTSCGATGVNGPAQSSCRSAYSTTWDESNANFTVANGIQIWTVPASGKYSITAVGAVGGAGRITTGGNGASIKGEFTLTEGEKIRILVGQPGAPGGSYNGGGGGATFVMKEIDNTISGIYVIAGGGGGGGYNANGTTVNAVTGTTGQAGWNGSTASSLNNAASYGNGGATYDRGASGGGGLLANGATTSGGCNAAGGYPGNSFVNGGAGGSGNYSGGFGGGAAGEWCQMTGGGGGGGFSGGSGGYYYGSGGGGGSYNNGTSQVNTAGANSSSGYVTITSLGPSLTTFAPRATITNNSILTYDVAFSEAVTGLTSSDFSLTGTGSSTCSVNAPVGTAPNFTVSVTGCSPGTVILTMAANAVANTSSQSAPTSNTAAATVTVDQTAPTISSVLAPANGSYKPGDTPTFTVAFNETVTITGTPRLVLTVGSATRYANYVSMIDSTTARFRYTVGTGTAEVDTNGIALATDLDLNSATISDRASNLLVIVTLTPPTLTSVLIVQPPAAPTIDSIAATSTQLSVNFRAGTTYGSSITNYQYSTDNGSTWITRSPVATTSPLVITGLTNNQSYQVRLRAVSAAGNSDSSTAVTGIPTAIVVAGDSTLTTTFGISASTGTYSASGGTGPYTFSLSSTANNISISGAAVSVSSTTPAGSYVRDVIATDSQSKTGQRQLTITVNKASSSIAVALQGGGTSSPVGASPVLSITTSQAGSVDFSIGGGGLPSCTAIAISVTTGSCTLPTPNSTGSITFVAIFTPTASNNYETSSATFTLNIVDGVSSVTLSLAGGVVEVPKGQTINIIAAIDQAGKVSFFADGKRIPGCFNRTFQSGNATCAWKPAIQKQFLIRVTLNPTNNVYNNSSSTLNVWVKRRSGLR